jgi:hypothetical protein
MSTLRRTVSPARRIHASLPGPARRITVEPIRVPATPKVVPSRGPSEPPKRPERSPEREPVPAR